MALACKEAKNRSYSVKTFLPYVFKLEYQVLAKLYVSISYFWGLFFSLIEFVQGEAVA